MPNNIHAFIIKDNLDFTELTKELISIFKKYLIEKNKIIIDFFNEKINSIGIAGFIYG